MRGLLLLTIALAVAVAGCAESPLPASTPTAAEAQQLFASAAGGVPDRYGLHMTATKDGTELMRADAAFDDPAERAYFEIKMDPSMMEDAEAMGGGSMVLGEDGEIAIYATRDGTALQFGDNVMIMPPSPDGDWSSMAGGEDGLGALTDPEEMLEELQANNVTVHNVTATTLRGKPALKLDVTFTEEGETQSAVIYLFQDPTRVARIEMVTPDDGSEFAGAAMVMDLLYDDEVTVQTPDGLVRALGLRYTSDRSSFGGFGGGGDEDGPETWSFQAEGPSATEIVAEVHESASGASGDLGEPLGTMTLSAGEATVEGVSLAFHDADADGKVSAGDTLVIERGEGAEGYAVVLKDTVSGLRVTPGAGLLLVGLALVAAALAVRRP